MTYELTIFKNQFDNKTHRKMSFSSWVSFVNLLENLSKQPKKGKKDAELISPAVYKEGTTRSNKNVEYWGKWAAVDVDQFEGDIFELFNRFHNFNFCAYSTASSTKQKAKFRIVFDLNRTVQESELRHFWFALNTFLGELGDPQTKDSSRMYYIPARYDNAFNFFEYNHGDPLDVDYLKTKYEFVEPKGNSFLDNLPLELQNQVIAHRKGQLNNRKYKWISYRDCPFFPRKLSREYQSINSSGWYHTMFRIMVSVACNAIKNGYPITAEEIEKMCKEFDVDNGNWYKNRPFSVEANSALDFAYRNTSVDFC